MLIHLFPLLKGEGTFAYYIGEILPTKKPDLVCRIVITYKTWYNRSGFFSCKKEILCCSDFKH